MKLRSVALAFVFVLALGVLGRGGSGVLQHRRTFPLMAVGGGSACRSRLYQMRFRVKQDEGTMVEKKVPNEHLVPSERIAERIYFVRGQKVMLDEDMAELYEVPTRRLNEQVTRNAGSFPVDFMFRLTAEEGLGFEIAKFDLKNRSGRSTTSASYLHGTRGGHVVERPDGFVGGADGAPIQTLPEAPNPRACGRALERVRARKEQIKLCPRRERSPLS